MKLRTLALVALAGCSQPITPHVGVEPEVPQEPTRPAPPPAPTRPATSPEACPAVPIATYCEPGAPCWKNPRPIATTTLMSVFSIGCTAWAIGRDGQVIKRTSEGWKPQQPFTSQYLYALAGTAEDDVWAVGMNSSIFHFDGVQWTEESMEWNTMPYQAAWTGERGVVYVAGWEAVHRFEKKDGRTTFTTLVSQEETRFTALIGKGNTLTALAGEQTMLGWHNVLWSFDGTTWTKTVLSNIDGSWLGSLTDVDGALYGAGQRRAGQDSFGYLSQVAPNSAPSSFTDRSIGFGGLAARSSKEIIVVGTGYPDSVLRFDGLSFTPILGVPERQNFFAITQSGRDYFLIGESLGRINSDTFIRESEGPTDQITGVVPLENGDVWLSNGWRSTTATGDAFFNTFTEPNRKLGWVAGRSSDDMWGADWYGLLWHFDGTAWSRAPNPPSSALSRLVITAPGQGFAMGTWSLWRLNGMSWTELRLPNTDITIHDMVVGTDGAIIVSASKRYESTVHFVWRVDTNTGLTTAIPAPQRLRLLAGRGSDDVFGVGDDTLFHFDGTTWTDAGPLPQERGSIMSAAVKSDGLLLLGTSSGRVIGGGGFGGRYFDRYLGASVAIYGLTVDPRTDEVWATGEGGTVVVLPL